MTARDRIDLAALARRDEDRRRAVAEMMADDEAAGPPIGAVDRERARAGLRPQVRIGGTRRKFI